MLTIKRINKNQMDKKQARRIRRKRNLIRTRRNATRSSTTAVKNYTRSTMVLTLGSNVGTAQMAATTWTKMRWLRLWWRRRLWFWWWPRRWPRRLPRMWFQLSQQQWQQQQRLSELQPEQRSKHSTTEYSLPIPRIEQRSSWRELWLIQPRWHSVFCSTATTGIVRNNGTADQPLSGK